MAMTLIDDKPCHQAGRVLIKSADKTPHGQNCILPHKNTFLLEPRKYCAPMLIPTKKRQKARKLGEVVSLSFHFLKDCILYFRVL